MNINSGRQKRGTTWRLVYSDWQWIIIHAQRDDCDAAASSKSPIPQNSDYMSMQAQLVGEVACSECQIDTYLAVQLTSVAKLACTLFDGCQCNMVCRKQCSCLRV
jgi:hypothetical protein